MGAWGAAGGVAAAEVCAPLLLMCWLCCWPGDDSSDSSSGKHPQKPVIAEEGGSHRRPADFFSRHFGSSAVSLHIPSTSGTKQPLSSHRSHEEIRSRRKSHHDVNDDGRYHSAPSVIDEVLHRRDWERSTKELYIPLKADNVSITTDSLNESSDPNEHVSEKTCKKHHSNIKSSRKKGVNKELLNYDVKDDDATETSPGFYIGEDSCSNNETLKTVHEAKDAKQSLNESIRKKDQYRPTIMLTEFNINEDADIEIDRSGAMHHSVESRSSLFKMPRAPVPPPSVEAVDYDADASYLEDDVLGAWKMDAGPVGPEGEGASWSRAGEGGGWARARHASAGDVLAPARRPLSAALSESDLDFELDAGDELPPAYDQLHLFSTRDAKETAI